MNARRRLWESEHVFRLEKQQSARFRGLHFEEVQGILGVLD
jgi:histidyl-tRNA synthetase